MKCNEVKCLTDALPELVLCEKHDDENKKGAAELASGHCPVCAKTGQKIPVKINSKTDTGYAYRCPKHGAGGFRVNFRRDSFTKGQLVQMEKKKAAEVQAPTEKPAKKI